ncbi:MAG: hypothetical protein ACFCUX_04595 [Candidatus Methylacidiphilales bacterium]
MKFSDVPNLLKFERFAHENSGDEVIQHAYQMVRARLEQVPEDINSHGIVTHGPEAIMGMKERCAAIEESTRIIWACAAATGNVEPPMWEEENPVFQDAINYFWQLPDLEWMELTHHYRISWEKRVGLGS